MKRKDTVRARLRVPGGFDPDPAEAMNRLVGVAQQTGGQIDPHPGRQEMQPMVARSRLSV